MVEGQLVPSRGMRNGPAVRRRRRWPWSRTGERDIAGVPRRATLLDPDLQARFERDGFVVVDILEPETVAELRRRHAQMDHERRTEWPWVEGFSTSVYDPRPEYRTAVLQLMDQHVAPALAGVLDDHQVIWANFLVKQPDADSVPPHVDWTFLDEDTFSSVTVWCPLSDTTATNGTLGVVRGSHRRIDFPRAANVPAYERCERVVEDLADRPVIPVRAGQAIIMDNRSVHFSTPNDTPEERVVVGCVLAPREAELHHYWSDEDGTLLRFAIDRSFYLSYVIGEPPAAAGGVLHVEPVGKAATIA